MTNLARFEQIVDMLIDVRVLSYKQIHGTGIFDNYSQLTDFFRSKRFATYFNKHYFERSAVVMLSKKACLEFDTKQETNANIMHKLMRSQFYLNWKAGLYPELAQDLYWKIEFNISKDPKNKDIVDAVLANQERRLRCLVEVANTQKDRGRKDALLEKIKELKPYGVEIWVVSRKPKPEDVLQGCRNIIIKESDLYGGV